MSSFALHGFTAGPEQWQKLLPDARCPSLVGHGPNPSLEAKYFDQELQRLALLAVELPRPRRLFGYSMGARVGLGLLIEHPDLFDDAVLVGGSPGLNDPAARSERLLWEQGWMRLLREQGVDAFVEEWERLPLFSSQVTIAAAERDAQSRSRRSHTAPGLVRALSVLGLGVMPSLWTGLARVKARVRLVAGQLDTKFAQLARAQAELMPRAEIVLIDGAGHNPLLEAPEAIVRFV